MMCRIALRLVQIGALAIVLAASPTRAFDLDRFLVPKELVLHLTAMLSALFAFGVLRRAKITKVDWLLAAYLGISVLSSLFAQNPWLAMRATALSASAILLFWVARELREDAAIMNALALAVVLAAVTSLLQTYGVWLDLFSANRAPGGTLGNRNFVAHAAAFGMPVVLYAVMRARLVIFPLIGVTILTAALVLTRSRAAWLAFAAVMIVFLYVLVTRRERRLLLVPIFIGAAVAAALLIPNTLRWRSDNPYLETAKSVANYQEGSGRGRLIQYERSVRMTLSSPLFGVGPGNWPVDYPEFAARRDPSLDPDEPGMTYNPWPSSDWVAFLSERGPVAVLLLAFAFLLIAKKHPIAFAMVAGAVVSGLFDAVLLLPLPAFIVFAALGALECGGSPAALETDGVRGAAASQSGGRAAALQTIVIVMSFIGVIRSTSQLIGMELYAVQEFRTSVKIDPGNYRTRMRLARTCAHAKAAHAMFPNSAEAKRAARRCD